MQVKETIKAKGFTLVEVAERIGISRVTLSQNLARNPTLTTLEKIANAIGCNVGEFFRDEIEPTATLTVSCPTCGTTIPLEINIKGNDDEEAPPGESSGLIQ